MNKVLFFIIFVLLSYSVAAIDIQYNNSFNTTDAHVNYIVNRTFAVSNISVNSNSLNIVEGDDGITRTFLYEHSGLTDANNLTSGLIHYFPFNYDNLTDVNNSLIGFEKDGYVVCNETGYDRLGCRNYVNDTNSKIRLNQTVNYINDSNFTMSFWFKPLEGLEEEDERFIFYMFNDARTEGLFIKDYYRQRVCLPGVDCPDTRLIIYKETGNTVTDIGTGNQDGWVDEWHQVVVKYGTSTNVTDNSTDKILDFYLDGDNFLSYDGYFINTTYNIQFGYQSENFDGVIDEVRFYDRALSDTEIINITNTTYGQRIDKPLYNITINTTTVSGLPLATNITITSPDMTQSAPIQVNESTASYNFILTDDNYTIYIDAHRYDSRNFYNQELTYLNNTATYVLSREGLIDNCTTHNTKGINFTLYNNTDGTTLIGNISGHFWAWIDGDSRADAAPINITWTNVTDFSMCIVDELGSYNFDGQMEYYAPGYDPQTYYWSDGTISYDPEQIDLYMIDGGTAVTFTVKDQDDKKIIGADIHILEYDLTTDTTKLITVIQTDTNGEAVGNLVLDTKKYKFLIFYRGELKLETQPTTLTLTTYNFRINLIENYMEHYDQSLDVVCSMVFDNETEIFTYTWADPNQLITESCFKVVKRTGFGDIELYNNCFFDTTGEKTYNINTSTKGDNSFIGTGTFKLDGVVYLCSTDTYTYDDRYQLTGDLGIFLTLLISVLLVFISFFNVPFAIIMSLIGIFISTLLGLFYLSTPMLVGLIVMGVIAIYKAR